MATKTKQSAKTVKKATLSLEAGEVKNSFYSKAKHLIGSVDSGVMDLSSNKNYLEGFGRSRNANHS